MKFIDLFAGIGGFHLGMEKAGHECVGWVEWDKFARQSYMAVHDGSENLWNEKDINDVKAFEMPKSDIWCFGFPCQDISVAGKQGGFTNGKRSSLFFTVAGLLRELSQEDKPRYLLIENVKNLLSINKGWDFAKLQIELDEIGYDVEWSVLDSAEVVPQHRERIYIIGHLRGASTRKVFPIRRENGEANHTNVNQIGNISDSNSQTECEPKVMVKEATQKGYDVATIGDSINISQPNSKTRRGRVGHGITNTLVTGSEQATLIAKPQFGRLGKQAVETANNNKIEHGDCIEPYNKRVRRDKLSGTLTTRPEGLKTAMIPVVETQSGYRIRKLTPRECWRLQGFPDELFDKAQQAGLSDSQLYKQAGNSVTVDVVYEIAKKLGE